MTDLGVAQQIRDLCLAYPQTQERVSHGEPAWFAGGRRMFVCLADHHHDVRVAIWAAAPEGAQTRLVQDEPRLFFVPPYVGTRGWVGVYLDDEPDWDRVAVVVRDAWRCIATARLVARYDGG